MSGHLGGAGGGNVYAAALADYEAACRELKYKIEAKKDRVAYWKERQKEAEKKLAEETEREKLLLLQLQVENVRADELREKRKRIEGEHDRLKELEKHVVEEEKKVDHRRRCLEEFEVKRVQDIERVRKEWTEGYKKIPEVAHHMKLSEEKERLKTKIANLLEQKAELEKTLKAEQGRMKKQEYHANIVEVINLSTQIQQLSTRANAKAKKPTKAKKTNIEPLQLMDVFATRPANAEKMGVPVLPTKSVPAPAHVSVLPRVTAAAVAPSISTEVISAPLSISGPSVDLSALPTKSVPAPAPPSVSVLPPVTAAAAAPSTPTEGISAPLSLSGPSFDLSVLPRNPAPAELMDVSTVLPPTASVVPVAAAEVISTPASGPPAPAELMDVAALPPKATGTPATVGEVISVPVPNPPAIPQVVSNAAPSSPSFTFSPTLPLGTVTAWEPANATNSASTDANNEEAGGFGASFFGFPADLPSTPENSFADFFSMFGKN